MESCRTEQDYEGVICHWLSKHVIAPTVQMKVFHTLGDMEWSHTDCVTYIERCSHIG